MNDAANTRKNLEEWALFFIALGSVLRFQGQGWDQGLMLNPDERNIVTAAASLSFPDALVPAFSAYNGLSVYLPRLLAEIAAPLTGHNGADPAAILMAGRYISATFATLTLPLLWISARSSLGIEAALFVVASAAFSPALIQSAHFGTTESGLIFCLSAITATTVWHMRGWLRPPSFAVLVGSILAFGFGLKTTALAFALCIIVAIAYTSVRRGEYYKAINVSGMILLVFVPFAIVTTPQILVAPKEYFATMRFESAVVWGNADVFWTYQFAGGINGLFEISQLPWLLGPLLPMLSIAGLMVFTRGLVAQESTASSLIPVFTFAIVYSAVIFAWHAKFVRYLLPLLPVLILFAGYFVTQLRKKLFRRIIMIGTVTSTAVVGGVQAMIYQVTDPRVEAWEWLLSELRVGDSIAIEPRDVGPPYWSPASLSFNVLTLPLLSPSSPAKISEIARVLEQSEWIIVASRRHHSVLPRMRGRYPEMCAYYQLLWSGGLGYELAATFNRNIDLPLLLDPEAQAEETLTVFDNPKVLVFFKSGFIAADTISASITKSALACAAN